MAFVGIYIFLLGVKIMGKRLKNNKGYGIMVNGFMSVDCSQKSFSNHVHVKLSHVEQKQQLSSA